MFEPLVYSNRRNELRGILRKGLILFLGNDYAPINYPNNAYKFRQDSNFLYYFGIDKANMVGVMDLEGGKDILYGDDFPIEEIIWRGEQPKMTQLAESVGVACTRPSKALHIDLTQALSTGRPIHFLPPYRAEHRLMLSELLGISPHACDNYVSRELVQAVIAQRSIKEACEIEELDRIAEVGYKMHVMAMKMAQPGNSEQEIAGMLEGIAHAYGYMTSFSTILSQNGQTLHNEDHNQKLSSGRLLLVDCGAESDLHYASDNTRTIPVGAKFSDTQLAIYNTVLAAHDLAIDLAKPGIPYQDIHLMACKELTKGLQAIGLMRGNLDDSVANGAHALFMPHGLGHMMGLDTHDMEGLNEDLVGYDQETKRSEQFGTASLRCGRKLQKGFVVTVEPGIYFIPQLIEKWKAEHINEEYINFDRLNDFLTFGGIRLEDDILITEDGCRLIGKEQIPIKPEDVIAVMNTK